MLGVVFGFFVFIFCWLVFGGGVNVWVFVLVLCWNGVVLFFGGGLVGGVVVFFLVVVYGFRVCFFGSW